MERIKKNLELKPLFLDRIKLLLPEEKDLEEYLKILKVDSVRSIRCNKLKISPEKLKENLEKKGWKISQPFKNYPELMIVENNLSPGELGRSLEHLLGYYYVQEIASMLPIICLEPKDKESVLDLCASPGSKTTQIAAELNNHGLIIANEPQMDRLRILASNLERCGVTNAIITRKDGRSMCKNLKGAGMEFDKILVDAPCSGEGTLRSSQKTYLMWNIKTIQNLPKIQERLFSEAFEILKVGGEIVYSTCTHAPEENEGVVNSILEKFGDRIKIEKIELPLKKIRLGLIEWQGKKYSKEVKNCARIYPHDNNTEGFFISKFRRLK